MKASLSSRPPFSMSSPLHFHSKMRQNLRVFLAREWWQIYDVWFNETISCLSICLSVCLREVPVVPGAGLTGNWSWFRGSGPVPPHRESTHHTAGPVPHKPTTSPVHQPHNHRRGWVIYFVRFSPGWWFPDFWTRGAAGWRRGKMVPHRRVHTDRGLTHYLKGEGG